MLDVTNLAATPERPDRLWTGAVRVAAEVLFRLPPRASVRLEGLENVPREPSILAPNHTHKFDFLPIRAELLKRSVRLATWIKARDYQSSAMALFFEKTGNVPLASRGYVIAADFSRTTGRRPTESEYRALRDLVDNDQSLDASPVFDLLKTTPRAILGVPFDPGNESYRQAIRRVYAEMMDRTLEVASRVRDAGIHQHIYPQGAVSSRLTPGRSGVVQAAHALRLPVIPVGISGCREVFVGSTPLPRGGDIVIRFGEAVSFEGVVPGSFRPFRPTDEDAHADALQSATDGLMERINTLLEPEYRWASDPNGDGKRGIGRFF